MLLGATQQMLDCDRDTNLSSGTAVLLNRVETIFNAVFWRCQPRVKQRRPDAVLSITTDSKLVRTQYRPSDPAQLCGLGPSRAGQVASDARIARALHTSVHTWNLAVTRDVRAR